MKVIIFLYGGMTLSVPKDVKSVMKKFPEINWHRLVKKSIIEKAQELEMKQTLLKQLKNEEEFNKWAVKVVREGRKIKSNFYPLKR